MTPNSNILGGTKKPKTQRLKKKTKKKNDDNRENKPKTELFENRPLVGFRFIENRSVSVSVSRRALL
jgi:hypothetical protein